MNLLKKLYHWSSTWTGTVVIVLSIIFFVAQAFVIPSGSMKNSLLIGDMLFVKKFAYGIPTPTIPDDFLYRLLALAKEANNLSGKIINEECPVHSNQKCPQ